MSTDVEIGRALAAIASTLNNQQLDSFDAGRVPEIVIESIGGEEKLTVDDGGGLHDESGARIGIVRRTPSGEWITERQNESAERSETLVPAASPPSKTKSLLGKLKPDT